jgi:hypothetical protein
MKKTASCGGFQYSITDGPRLCELGPIKDSRGKGLCHHHGRNLRHLPATVNRLVGMSSLWSQPS